MRIGMSFSSTSTLPVREAAEHLLARVRAARDAGLDSMSFGDNHVRTGVRYFQNTPTLGRALAEWDPQRPAGCLFLVPLWPPVLMAEQIGTLAAFHPGPFVVQTGLGSPSAFARVGVPERHRARALEEAVRVVGALFAGDTVSSEMFGIRDARVDLVPPDGVEWWMGTMSEAGVERAARTGMAWYPSPGATSDQLVRLLDRYRTACGDAGTRPQVALRRDAVVLADGDRARGLAADAVAAGYRGLSGEVLLAGTPDDVAEALAPFADLGVDQIVGRTMGLDPAVDLDTIAGLGRVRSLLPADRP